MFIKSDKMIVKGDVVQLKSGGPIMTVERFYEEWSGRRYAKCAWFVGNGVSKQNFVVDTLKKVRDV